MKEPTKFMVNGEAIFEQIEAKVDYDLLVSKMFTPWCGIVNYKIVIDGIPLPGYTKFKVNNIPLGELGTFEVKKEIDGCTINFSNVTIIENWEEIFKQAEPENSIRIITQKMAEIDMELVEARTKEWQEIIDNYHSMINKINKPELQPQVVPEIAAPPPQKGRNRLEPGDIKYRKGIVKLAKNKKREDPTKTWKLIAFDLDIPERTLRSWRHDPKI